MAAKIAFRTLVAGAIVVTVNDRVFDAHVVTGNSMAPALSPDYNLAGRRDAILVRKGDFRSETADSTRATRLTLQRGDVVAFWKPHDPESMSVKRVVGLPGDVVWRDMRRVGSEAEAGKRFGMGPQAPAVHVPPGHVFVEGDNWRDSFDSHDFGPIPSGLITGRAVGIIWPPSRAGSVPSRIGKDASRTVIVPGVAELPAHWH
ncbi:LexA/Signal peptidase [Trichodelitschia bisporula]|uniref:Mitochondrial inner membrane protease subunit n=1 Tax=Trichodelitschia bisporula TaxID=703511 RepID=A0A6G1I1E4_9PEZI|nr:LexA/Signal peptidase [Trichodelitschia bisporula]